MYRLIGSIETQSPLTVSYPDLEGLPRTPHGEIMIESGTFRGPLRKAALTFVRRELAAIQECSEAEVFDLRDVYMLGEGVDTTREINNESREKSDPVGEARLRALNPMISAFGRWRLGGRISTSPMIAPAASVMTAGRGARTDIFERDPEAVGFLSPEEQDRLERQLHSAKEIQLSIDRKNGDAKKARREGAKATSDGNKSEGKRLYGEAERLEEEVKALKQEREGPEEAIKHPLAGYEAIAPHTTLSHRLMALDEPTLAVLLAGLAEMSRTPFLGGHRSDGCGEFTGEWRVFEYPKGSLEPVELGVVRIEDGFHIDNTSGDLKDVLDTFRSSMASYDFRCHTLAQARSA